MSVLSAANSVLNINLSGLCLDAYKQIMKFQVNPTQSRFTVVKKCHPEWLRMLHTNIVSYCIILYHIISYCIIVCSFSKWQHLRLSQPSSTATPRPRLQAVGCLSSAGQLRSATPKPEGDTRGNPSSQGMTSVWNKGNHQSVSMDSPGDPQNLVYLSSLSIEHSHSIFWEKKILGSIQQVHAQPFSS
jgi:hypothetical protein